MDNWIDPKKEQPIFMDGEFHSENVLAVVSGELAVMCYAEIMEDAAPFNAWCSCHGDIDGDGEYDDLYDVTHWQYFPKLPKTLTP
jgi:hypothetical protein